MKIKPLEWIQISDYKALSILYETDYIRYYLEVDLMGRVWHGILPKHPDIKECRYLATGMCGMDLNSGKQLAQHVADQIIKSIIGRFVE